jgi:hypothetical protein
VTWDAGTSYRARRIPLDVKTIASYQALDTVVTDRYIFGGDVTVQIGKNRIVDGAKTYAPVSSAKHFDTPMWAEVLVRQI